MYLKKRILIFLALFFMPMLNISAPAASTQASEKAPTANTEPSESPEKSDEPISFCSSAGLLKSDFIRTSVWPGVGPFDIVSPADSGSSQSSQTIKLTDPSHNSINCTTNGNEVSTCELELHNSVSESQGLLNLQIGTDFLLEGLGVKPRQIHVVNLELSNKSNLLSGNNYNPLSVIIAPLTVSFQNLGKKEGTNSPVFRVAIVNQKETAEKVASASTPDTSEPNGHVANENKTSEIDTASMPDSHSNKTETSEAENVEQKNSISSAKNDSALTKPSPSTIDEQGTDSGAKTNKTVLKKPLSASETLKTQFLDLITNWQHIKKTAVRERQTNELSQVLAGKALIRQSDAIKWLAGNHKYYEMLSQGAVIEHFDALVPGKKYAVFAEVKEKMKYVDDANKQPVKETDDTYKVNYTVEKIGAHWLITDSALIKQGTKQAGPPKLKH